MSIEGLIALQRHSATENAKRVTGYAARWMTPTEVATRDNRWVEILAPNSLIWDERTFAAWEHRPELLLGSIRAGTLALVNDELGLRYSIILPPTSAGDEAWELTRRGDLAGASIRFAIIGDGETWDRGVTPHRRTITKARVIEVSLTALPAQIETTAKV